MINSVLAQEATQPSGIGIDMVEIERFALWHHYSQAQLQRIFHPDEITYCLQHPQKSAERFAARFAAREALWKAICQTWPAHTLAFLTFCRAVQVAHTVRGVPYFILNETYISTHIPIPTLHPTKILLSLTHTKKTATALTIISQL